jgi:hypothetical protein
MQENFAGYTKCVFDNRKKLPKDCEQWAGVQGACAGDMTEHCARQNPVRTTRCLKEKADKLTTACKESQYFKSLDSGYGKFRDNYKAAGGDDVFEHDPSMFGDAFKNAGGSFTDEDMEAIKKAAMESVFSSNGAGAGADQQGFGGQQNFGQQPPGGAGGGNGDASGLKRAPPGSRLTGREEKLEAIDDL